MVPHRSVIAVAWSSVRLLLKIPATTERAIRGAYGPGASASAAVVRPPSAISVVVRAVTLARRVVAA
ncbi:hypothetical protein SMICM17S_03273 [Streptomyces microflavus]